VNFSLTYALSVDRVLYCQKNSPKGMGSSRRLISGLSELSIRRAPASPGVAVADEAAPAEDDVVGCVTDGVADD
jgi:hypothetical protein